MGIRYTASDSGIQIIDTTYQELLTLQLGGNLIAGAIYRFPHTTIHNVVGTSPFVRSDAAKPAVTEVLRIQALGESELSTEAVSELHPRDEIRYTTSTEGWQGYEIGGVTEGQITYRKAYEMGRLFGFSGVPSQGAIEGSFDVRYCVFCNGHTDLSGVQTAGASQADIPVMWQLPDINYMGSVGNTLGYYTLVNNGNVTYSYCVPWDSATTYNYRDTKFGNYAQNVVVLASRQSEVNNVCFTEGDFSNMYNVRVLGGLRVLGGYSATQYGESFGQGRASVKNTIISPQAYQFSEGGLSIGVNTTMENCLSVFGVTEIGGTGGWFNCTFIPSSSLDFWRRIFWGQSSSFVNDAIFNGNVSNRYFTTITPPRRFDMYENLRNFQYDGYVNRNFGQRLLKEIDNGHGGLRAKISSITPISNASIWGVVTDNFFEISPSTSGGGIVIIPEDSAFAGICNVNGVINTINRTRKYGHVIKLVWNGVGSLNAGGNIVNATGTAFVAGNVSVLMEYTSGNWVIIA